MLSQPAVLTCAQSESLWAVSNREKVFQSPRLILSFSDWLLIWSQTDLSTLDRDVLCVFVCCFACVCAHCWGFLLSLETVMFESATFSSFLLPLLQRREGAVHRLRWDLTSGRATAEAGADSEFLPGPASIPSSTRLPMPVLLLPWSDRSSAISALIAVLPKHRHLLSLKHERHLTEPKEMHMDLKLILWTNVCRSRLLLHRRHSLRRQALIPLSCHTPHQSCTTKEQSLAPEISSSPHWNICRAFQWLRYGGCLQVSQWCPGSVFQHYAAASFTSLREVRSPLSSEEWCFCFFLTVWGERGKKEEARESDLDVSNDN